MKVFVIQVTMQFNSPMFHCLWRHHGFMVSALHFGLSGLGSNLG